MIQTEPMEPIKAVVQRIVIAGVEVGTLEEWNKGKKYHAVLRMPALQCTADLLQGFGDTVDECIADAIARGRVVAYAHNVSCDWLEKNI